MNGRVWLGLGLMLAGGCQGRPRGLTARMAADTAYQLTAFRSEARARLERLDDRIDELKGAWPTLQDRSQDIELSLRHLHWVSASAWAESQARIRGALGDLDRDVIRAQVGGQESRAPSPQLFDRRHR